MRTIVLSDHTGDMIDAIQQGRQQEFEESGSAATHDSTSRHQTGRQSSRATSGSRGFFSVFRLIRVVLARLTNRASSQPLQPAQRPSSDREQMWRSGNEGEQRVAAYLADHLSDDWTLISGYRGEGGEIDQIIVGPGGICAIEVKNLNGTLYIDGDRWLRDKYDRYGNRVEVGEVIADRRGRSPSAQINGAVSPLQSFISKGSRVRRVGRAIILSHDRSEVGQVSNPTVEYVTTLDGLDVRQLLTRSSDRLDRDSVDGLVQLIQGSHIMYNHRNGSGSRPRARSRARRRSGSRHRRRS